MSEPRARYTDDEPKRNAERLAFFSDAVFAIAITLLVLDIRLPTSGISDEPTLNAHLADLGPHIFAFVLTFVLIGLYWTKHHASFQYIVRVDGRFVWMNIFFLMTIAWLPFPTAVLAEYGDFKMAAILYAASNALTSGIWAAVWFYAWRNHRLVRTDLDLGPAAEGTARGLAVCCGFLISIVVALVWGATWAEWLWILLIPASLAVTRMTRRRLGGSPEARPESKPETQEEAT